LHIARGDVYESSEHRIGLSVPHDDLLRLHKLASRALPTKLQFRMDRDSGATGVGTLRQNLINLLTGDKKTNSEPGNTAEESHLPRLRELLLNLHPPKYDDWKSDLMFHQSPGKTVRTQVPSCDLASLETEFKALNLDQQSAVRKVFVAADYTLIQGLPGTGTHFDGDRRTFRYVILNVFYSGKTSTIAFLVKLLVAHNKRVLVTSYTHSAVDNVLMKLIDDGMASTNAHYPMSALARVDRYFKCHERVKPFIVESLASKLEEKTTEELPSAESMKCVVASAMVVGVSALTIPRSSCLIDQHFDVVIVDEAGQISQPAIIGALMAAKSFVLVGDQMQLPPIALSELSTERGMKQTQPHSQLWAHSKQLLFRILRFNDAKVGREQPKRNRPAGCSVSDASRNMRYKQRNCIQRCTQMREYVCRYSTGRVAGISPQPAIEAGQRSTPGLAGKND
jgi:AAA domain